MSTSAGIARDGGVPCPVAEYGLEAVARVAASRAVPKRQPWGRPGLAPEVGVRNPGGGRLTECVRLRAGRCGSGTPGSVLRHSRFGKRFTRGCCWGTAGCHRRPLRDYTLGAGGWPHSCWGGGPDRPGAVSQASGLARCAKQAVGRVGTTPACASPLPAIAWGGVREDTLKTRGQIVGCRLRIGHFYHAGQGWMGLMTPSQT
jgi:hypothetical protein